MNFKFIKTTFVGLVLSVSSFANAGLIIEYSDVGTDLLFSWSGSLNAIAGDGIDPIGGPTYATIGVQSSGNNPTFYSAPLSHPPGVSGVTYTGANNPGLFATNAPTWSSFMTGSTSTGLPFLFRVNNAISGTTSVNIWADWGAANTAFSGTMTIAGQSIASMGMVDGYNLQLNIGNITFQEAGVNVPEPSTLAIFALGMIGLASRRFKKQ